MIFDNVVEHSGKTHTSGFFFIIVLSISTATNYHTHLRAGLAGGQVIDPGQGDGEGGALALGEVAEQLVRGLARVGGQEEGARLQLEVVLGGQGGLVYNPGHVIMSSRCR